MQITNFVLFGLFWFGMVYLVDSLLARQFKKIDLKLAVLYFATVAMIGVFGEIFLDTAYNYFVGVPLWRYNILPVHNGYTSLYAPIIWGIYGFHIYLLHGTLGKWSITKTKHLALILCIEALVLEALLTLSARLFFGDLMYYYYPNDLWHITSIQNIPFYYICGVVIVKTIRRFKSDPQFYSKICVALICVILFFTR